MCEVTPLVTLTVVSMVDFRRKMYKRGSSYETTLPMPLLFALDSSKKHDVIFRFDSSTQRWYLAFEEREENVKIEKQKSRKKSRK